MNQHRLHKCEINSYLSKWKREKENLQKNAAEEQGIWIVTHLLALQWVRVQDLAWVGQRQTQVLNAGAFSTTADFQLLALTYKETSLVKSSNISAQQGCMSNNVTGKKAIILQKREAFCTSDFRDILF